ncbi:hypothetical protein [Comamonas thiooxydans]|uniref:hypothetical protein n=1 Tax=Comamonas thiooxydans TaxID=363952 RepID=UPI00103C1405|nr:hypothetical protein [Comamonas thiooxydans]
MTAVLERAAIHAVNWTGGNYRNVKLGLWLANDGSGREQPITLSHGGLLTGVIWWFQSTLLPKNCPIRRELLFEKFPVISRNFYASAFLQESQS